MKNAHDFFGEAWIKYNATEADTEMQLYLSIEEIEFVDNTMEEYAKESIIDYENWKKSKGINWNINNAMTPAQELFELYKNKKQ